MRSKEGMAKKQLTIEEKLEAALVPVEEQPYKVPDNWCWVRLGAVCSFVGGGTPSKQNPEFWNGNISWASVKDIKGDYLFETIDSITEIGCQNSATNICEENDLLLVTRIEPGKTIISKIRTAINQDIKIVKSELPAEPLHYFFKTFRYEFIQRASGSTVKGITIPSVQNVPLPLPPQKEFNRIVTRIESFFAKLDEAKEKIQEVLDGADLRRAAILHQAFTGKLTEKWRREKGVSDDSWDEKIFNDVLDVRDGTHDSPVYYDEGFPLITSKNLKNGQIIDDNVKYISRADYEKINERSKVDIGDILFAMIGTIGNPVVVEEEPKFAIKNVALFKSIGNVNPYYVRYYLESKWVIDKMEREAKGSTQKFVSLKYLRNFPIRVPVEDEQKEIVRLLDNLLSREQSTVTACEEALTTIDTLKKSILARAFRGELGTNDPAEPNAKELLKDILSA